MREKLLKTPQGAESIFLDEAYKHEKINEVINGIYTGWGYLPIKTPVFDYYDTYRNLMSEEAQKNCFRLMDRDGELLVLRNDITLFLARQLGRVAKKNEVLRVHYADSILRHQSEIDISSNEFFQTGAELVGSEGISGDLEAITLLHTIIEDLKLNDTEIHLGSRAILDCVVNKYLKLDSSKLIELINLRDRSALVDFITAAADNEIAEKVADMFMFIGTYTEFNDYISSNSSWLKDLGVTDELNYLKDMGDILETLNMLEDFRFDLSEVANQDYYSGIVFAAYSKSSDSAIATGGRYDHLISSFGEEIPSVGFSIMLRKVEKVINDERFTPPQMNSVEYKGDFAASFREAAKLRAAGKCAVISNREAK